MDQQEINRREWEDPRNWRGARWLAVYASRRDTRTWVPKRVPAMGWTLNLGRKSGIVWAAAIVVGIPVAIAVVALLMGTR